MRPEKKRLLTDEEKMPHRLNLSYTQRFYLLMRLIKLDRKMKAAKISYPGGINKTEQNNL